MFGGAKHPNVCVGSLTNKMMLRFTLCYNEAVNPILICGSVAENNKRKIDFFFKNLIYFFKVSHTPKGAHPASGLKDTTHNKTKIIMEDKQR